jgi:hypothetical protein
VHAAVLTHELNQVHFVDIIPAFHETRPTLSLGSVAGTPDAVEAAKQKCVRMHHASWPVDWDTARAEELADMPYS